MRTNSVSKKAVFVWSGGKDSALALYQILQNSLYEVTYLLTTVSEPFNRVAMHGVRVALLEQQARALKLPFMQVRLPDNPSMEKYNALMAEAFGQLKQTGITVAVFGDIYLEDLRTYREQQMNAVGLEAVFPLWQQAPLTLIQTFISLKFKAVLVCLNARYFPKTFAGREIGEYFLRDLPAGVDPCGENGEYHSFVYDGPLFSAPVSFTFGEVIRRTYGITTNSSLNYDRDFWFIDLKQKAGK